MKNYGDAVAFLGQWGRFQQAVFFLLCASIMPNGFGAFTLVFMNDIPSHHCRVPESNLTEEWLTSVIPLTEVNGKQELSKCSRYRLDVVRNLSARGFIPHKDINLSDIELEGCVDGLTWCALSNGSSHSPPPFSSLEFFWGHFSQDHCQTDLEENRFCLQQWQHRQFLPFFQSSQQHGFGLSSSSSSTDWGAEIFTGNVRVLYSSMGTCCGFAVGYMLLPLCAYFLRDWKSLLLALSVPCVAYIPLWWILPESPRWLLSQGRIAEAEAVVKMAAKWNKVQAPSNIFECNSVEKTDTQKEHYNVFDLLRHSRIRTTTLLLCFVLFTLITGYYCLSFNTSQLHTDPYISCFISALVEIPAYASSFIALRYFPRRLSIIVSLIAGAVPLYLIPLVPEHLSSLSLTLEMVSKYSFTTGASLMFAYTTELYPTVLRNTATGTTTTISRMGSCITPFLLSLSVHYKYLPYVILATLAVVTAISAYFLPESFKLPLPETIEQMHERQRKIHLCNKRNISPVSLDDSR
ncbi:solute carrier family 22 member 5 isoform X3 [Oryzias latipes]|uniref:solute carrier family 22 member 5 isoform X3 n=1 Tax=Oryzias latipes TaxID=8090 RepID=UPI0009DB3BC3|nr:solute carrier family 22 member 5 isoform X3 [Oryzias latipes]